MRVKIDSEFIRDVYRGLDENLCEYGVIGDHEIVTDDYGIGILENVLKVKIEIVKE